MGLTLRPDPHHPAGGHAILAGPGVGGVSALSVENVFSAQFLGPDGKWGKVRHAFAVVPARDEADALCLGPEIVDHILTDLMVALRDGGGAPLGRLVWPDAIVPRRDAGRDRVADGWVGPAAEARDREPAEPLTAPAPVDPPSAGPTEPAQLPEVDDPTPLAIPRRRPWPILAAAAVMAVAALAAGSLWPHHRDDRVVDPTPPTRPTPPAPVSTPVAVSPPTPTITAAERCAKTFDAKVAAAQDAPDGDRIKLAEEAIGASCGAQAFQAVDGTRWETSEPAAWYQARFYDPDETAPVFRDGHPPDARAALDYYARWADRSPRQAEALRKLCAAHPDAVGDNAQRKRACAR